MHVSDINLTDDALAIVTDGDRTVFAVAAPTIVAVDEEDEEGELVGEEDEMQEPEVIERGKRDEDEEGEE